MPCLRWWLLVVMISGVTASANAEEGLWTFDQTVRSAVAQKLNIGDDRSLPESLRKNVVRFASGASGTLISARGLILTLRSVAMPCLHAASSSGVDYEEMGFRTGENKDLSCPDLSIERFANSEDVSSQLRAGLGESDDTPSERITALEQKCHTESGLECRVRALFGGARLQLERYRRYGDVRLVFAPEHRVAAFGPPSSRMIFPSQSLDVAFFRIYEQGRPLESGPPTPWQAAGPAENDPVIVAAYTAPTDRYLPKEFLALLGSSVYRLEAQNARAQAQALLVLSRKSPESATQEDTRANLERMGTLIADTVAVLENDPVRLKRRAAEADWRKLLDEAGPELAKTAWASAAAARVSYEAFYRRYGLIEGDRVLPFGRLFDLGRKLLRLHDQRQKPEGQRLPNYQGGNLAAIERELVAPVPLSLLAERTSIETGLRQLRAQLGADDPLVRALAGEDPAVRAAHIVASTQLFDAAARKKMLAGATPEGLSNDPLLVFVRAVEAEAMPIRLRYEHEVRRHLASFSRLLGQRVSAAAAGDDLRYPDAAGDLRFSSGRVVGYRAARRAVPALTTMASLATHALRSRPGSPWQLPPLWNTWLKRTSGTALTTPINFLTDADVGSGAPGAPVLNPRGELVGMIINVTSKSGVNRFVYRGGDDRAIAVHPAAILEALRQVYGAEKLADELVPGHGKVVAR